MATTNLDSMGDELGLGKKTKNEDNASIKTTPEKPSEPGTEAPKVRLEFELEWRT